jgi:pilus assembly protein CpaB
MRMKSLILIFIALGCGLVASIGISQVMNRDSGASNLELDQILVALADIDIGAKLDAQNVKLEDWPKNKIPAGAVRRLEDVKDKFANARFFKGEPLHISKISDTLRNIAVQVPEGYRAMPVKVDEDTVMKAVSPGDRVDVMVFLRRNGQDLTETGAFTILKNVRVFAINTNTERATDEKGSAANFRTVSLLVKPEHARELVVAAQMGKIILTLRRPDQTDEESEEEMTPLSEILSGRSKLASEPTNSAPNSGPGFLGMLKGIVPSGQSQGTGAAQPYKTMLLMTPNERKQYEWYDPNNPHELPVEVPLGGSAPTLAPQPAPPAHPTPVNSPTPASESLENPDRPGVINAPAAGSDKSGPGKDAK